LFRNLLSFRILAILLPACLILFLFLLNRSRNRLNTLKLKIQDLREQANILTDQKKRELKNQAALGDKISQYGALEKIIEEINQGLSLESVGDKLCRIAFDSVGGSKGLSALFLVDSKRQGLSLYKSRKVNPGLVIKSKEGDIFDYWVFRHLSPLIIEDTKADFRFDPERLNLEEARPVGSLCSAPLISGHRLLGILRLENASTRYFSQDSLRFLVTISDIGAVALENAQLFEKMQDLATHDELTGLFTKGHFLERLQEEYKRSLRQERPLTCLMLDIDYFKNYNDKFGHIAGDIVLKAISKAITSGLADLSSVISRFGGEEFCVLLYGVSKEEARKIAEGLRSKIEETSIVLRRSPSNVTVSIGIASLPQDTKDENELIALADKFMYEAKSKGRNRVC